MFILTFSKGRLTILFLAIAVAVLLGLVVWHWVPRIEMAWQYVRMRKLERRVVDREASGGSAACSYEILAEAHWIISYRHDPVRLKRRLDDLENVLAHPELEMTAQQQDPSDGGWGQCHEEWFFKVNATYDHLTKPSNENEKPKYPIHLFDRVNSPEKLRAYFDGIAISDVERTGVNNRRELNESLSNLTRLILHDRPVYYPWHPQLKGALMDVILSQLRDPGTGWWGERFVRNGRVEFEPDLSITFHVVSYLHGDVPDMGKIVDHLLAVKNREYPKGWLEYGGYANHHNMDVVTLFRLGWPSMNDMQKRSAIAEIQKMLDWCLNQSLQPDGSFERQAADGSDSIEETESWGVSFLSRIGYFDPSKRFWTNQEFPQAAEVRQRIIEYIRKHQKAGGAGGTYYEDDLRELGLVP